MLLNDAFICSKVLNNSTSKIFLLRMLLNTKNGWVENKYKNWTYIHLHTTAEYSTADSRSSLIFHPKTVLTNHTVTELMNLESHCISSRIQKKATEKLNFRNEGLQWPAHTPRGERQERVVARTKNTYRFLPSDRSALIDPYAFYERFYCSRWTMRRRYVLLCLPLGMTGWVLLWLRSAFDLVPAHSECRLVQRLC